MNKNFPVIDDAEVLISCFNCYNDIYHPYFFKSGNAPGRGQYFASCECCGYRNFFDFGAKNNAKNIDRSKK